MTDGRATLVLTGQVVVAAGAERLETAEAIGIADGRVVAVGSRDEVMDATAPGARLIPTGTAAIVPGIHDFHLHLVGMARARRTLELNGVLGFDELIAVVRAAADATPPGGWLHGRGWSEATLQAGRIERLAEAVGDRPALIYSHDSHSAWASAAARGAARMSAVTEDPPGGRIERDEAGALNGLLRESAADLVAAVAARLRGPALDAELDEVLAELAGLGVTGATDAGDTTADNGVGEYAALGDSASLLFGARARLDGRLRLTLNVPAAAIADARHLNLRTGVALAGSTTVRAGWAKAYADGALGSRTAALFDPYTCGDGSNTGILRLPPDELDSLLARGRGAGIGLAVHAIGDRTVATALDAMERSTPRQAGTPPDRIEHAQLVRAADRPRFAELGVTASLQPVHCASDRPIADACWSDRLADAYPWRAMSAVGALLAFGSDAPIETPNPWIGLYAAVHRAFPNDGTPDWQPDAALDAASALAAYTRAPAVAIGRPDEGHIGVGAHADLAVLNVDLATLLAADERLAEVRSELTLVGGREVQRA
ncbi:MAG: amidohydrolase family protein [Chloroflexota bacterium]